MAKFLILLIVLFSAWNIYKRLNPPQTRNFRRSGPEQEHGNFEGKDVSDGEFKEVE